MAISSEQRAFLTKSLKKAIDKVYGEDIPTLKAYTDKRRASFIDTLRVKVSAINWEAKIKLSSEAVASKRSALTRMVNEQAVKEGDAGAELKKAQAEALADYEATMAKLKSHYAGGIHERTIARNDAESTLDILRREAYFAVLEIDDDGRRVYGQNPYDIGDAISSRVNRFVEHNLESDELGAQVAVRVEQEQLVGDIAYIAKNVEKMREQLLTFIQTGRLPKITMVAWNIEDGKDIS